TRAVGGEKRLTQAGRKTECKAAAGIRHEITRNRVGMLAQRTVMQIIRRRVQQPVESQWHADQRDADGDHMQADDARDDGLEADHRYLSSAMRYPTPRMVWICTLAPCSASCLRRRWTYTSMAFDATSPEGPKIWSSATLFGTTRPLRRMRSSRLPAW